MLTLNDICSLITDGSHFSPEDKEQGYPMFSVKDMNEDGFDYSECKHIGEEAFRQLVNNGCRPQKDDVVVAKDGSYLKTAFVIKEECDIALLSSIAILRPIPGVVEPEYLAYFLKSPSVYRTVSMNYISGTALKRIILKGLKKIGITLPSIDEQQYRTELLNHARQTILLRKQQLQQLDELVKARFVEMFGDPEYNTKAWTIQTLDKLCNVGSSKRIYQNEQSREGVPFWRISDLVSKMDTGTADSGLFIPEERYMELRKH